MPLCTLELEPARLSAVGGLKAAKAVCDKALDLTHHLLDIPDPEDREMRIVTRNNASTKLTIEFTVGPHEYPRSKPEAFFPISQLLYDLSGAIHTHVQGVPLVVEKTELKVWEHTTFLLRSTESPPAPRKAE